MRGSWSSSSSSSARFPPMGVSMVTRGAVPITRHGRSSFIGLDAAIHLYYTVRNDESTRCHCCPNECARRA